MIMQFVLLLVGIYLIAGGVRGRLRLSDPRCAKCSYDLRTFGERPVRCPECGNDLTVPGSVHYAERDRQPYKTYAGAMLVLAAVVIPLVALFVGTPAGAIAGAPVNVRVSMSEAQAMSNTQLIEGVRSNLNSTSLWTEIHNRTVSRDLPPENIETLIKDLIAVLLEYRDQANIIGLMRARDFIQVVVESNLIDDQLQQEFLTALYPSSPFSIDLLGRVHPTDFALKLNVAYPEFRRHFGFELAVVIHSITVNGEEQSISHSSQNKYAGQSDSDKVISLYRHRSDVRATLPVLPVGEHEFIVDIELVVFPPDADADLPTLWKNYPKKWPTPLLRDRRQIKDTFEVVDKSTPLLDLVDDATSGKEFDKTLIITGVTIMPSLESDELVARVQIAYGAIPNLDYVFNVAVEVEGFPLTDTSVEQIVAITDGSDPFIPAEASLQSWEDEFDLPASATGQEQINIHLIPVPNGGDHATQHLDKLWSKELIFRDVPTRRASDQTK